VKIPILPLHALTGEWEDRLAVIADADPFGHGAVKHSYFGPSGRWLLGAALASRGLERPDEIAIITTSDETYVSTCVSVIAFNFAKISRVVTPNTRVVVVIHEFGFVCDDIRERIENWQRAGIFVVEDCAHIVGLDLDGGRLGGFGDMALYSLPKVVPVQSGGILRTRELIKLPVMSEDQRAATTLGVAAAERYLGKYRELNAQRLKIAHLVARMRPSDFAIFAPSSRAVPWHAGFVTSRKDQVVAANPLVEWGQTLRQDLLYLPTNPLVDEQIYRTLMASLA